MPDLLPEDEQSLDALARGIDYADGFALFYARVNARPTRVALADSLRARLGDTVEVAEVEVPADTRDLQALLAERLADLPDTDRQRAVFVYGLENVLSEARDRGPFLRILNFKRENLQRTVPHPVVLWVPEFALRILAVEAPDLWAWRSSVLDFSTPREDTDRAWSAVESGGSEDEYQRMTPSERRERIRSLEDLYNEYSDREDADEPDLLRIRFDLSDRLGRLHRDTSDLARATECSRRALALAERLGNYSSTALASNNLGSVLEDCGDIEGAEQAFRRALAIDEAAYGPDHPTVATDINNIGSVLDQRGDLDGAEQAYRRALAIDEAAYGPDHPTVAIRVNNIGFILRMRGDLNGAERAYSRALDIMETYSPDHPHTRVSRNNLAFVLAKREAQQRTPDGSA